MPDDQTNEEIAEQTDDQELPGEVDEALKSFMEEDDETAGDDDIKPDDDHAGKEKTGDETDDSAAETDKNKPPEKTAGSEKKTDEDPDPDENKTPEYPDALNERLKKTSGMREQDPPKPDEEKPPAPGKKPPEKKPDTQTKDIDFENLVSLDNLPDYEIKIGDHSINLKEYQEDYPDDFAAIMALGAVVAKNIIQQRLDSGQYVKAEKVDQLHDKIDDIEFWDQIVEKHSDARKINKSPDFLNWLDEQDEPLKRLAENMQTPDDGILILDFYKKSRAKKKAADYDGKAKSNKKKTDDLHKGTMRTRQSVQPTDDVDMNDAEAAFNEDD